MPLSMTNLPRARFTMRLPEVVLAKRYQFAVESAALCFNVQDMENGDLDGLRAVLSADNMPPRIRARFYGLGQEDHDAQNAMGERNASCSFPLQEPISESVALPNLPAFQGEQLDRQLGLKIEYFQSSPMTFETMGVHVAQQSLVTQFEAELDSLLLHLIWGLLRERLYVTDDEDRPAPADTFPSAVVMQLRLVFWPDPNSD